MKGKSILVAFLIFLIPIAIFSCDLGFSDSEITVYPTMCEGILTDGNCNGLTIPLNRMTYKMSVKTQQIIYWMPGFNFPPSRLVNCVVRDRKNWVGEYSDGSGKETMVNGKLLRDDFPPNWYYISKWRWWYIHITGKL